MKKSKAVIKFVSGEVVEDTAPCNVEDSSPEKAWPELRSWFRQEGFWKDWSVYQMRINGNCTLINRECITTMTFSFIEVEDPIISE